MQQIVAKTYNSVATDVHGNNFNQLRLSYHDYYLLLLGLGKYDDLFDLVNARCYCACSGSSYCAHAADEPSTGNEGDRSGSSALLLKLQPPALSYSRSGRGAPSHQGQGRHRQGTTHHGR